MDADDERAVIGHLRRHAAMTRSEGLVRGDGSEVGRRLIEVADALDQDAADREAMLNAAREADARQARTG